MATPVEDIEIEVEDGEAGSLESRVNCRKAKGHCEMIPVGKFTVDRLPPAWRDRLVWLHIMQELCTVMKVKVPCISQERPEGYLFYEFRGQKIPTCGSGYFGEDLNALINKKPIDCPIIHCTIPHPHKVTPMFKIATATHVIFDDTEAHGATVEFFFDSEGSRVVTAEVFKVDNSGIGSDRCHFYCVCHDLDLFKKIVLHKVACVIWMSLNIITPTNASSNNKKSPLVVVIGHPHGCPKYISLGDWVSYQEGEELNDLDFTLRQLHDLVETEDPTWRETGSSNADRVYLSPDFIRDYQRAMEANTHMKLKEYLKFDQMLHFKFITYTAATCPGSSGGLVTVLLEEGGRKMYLRGGAHFKGKGKGKGSFINSSGVFGLPLQGGMKAFIYKCMKSVRKEKQ